MDWKRTFNHVQWIIHGIFVVAVVLGVAATMFTLRLNHLQSTEEERGLKISSIAEYFKKDMSFEKIGKLLSWAESERANDKMRELTQKIAETEEILEIKSSEELSKNMRVFNKLISSNSGVSDPSDALKLLRTKVLSLNELAKSKKYTRVEQVSGKMRERLDILTPKNVGDSVQVSNLISDFKRLETLVAQSTLDGDEKKSLQSRFKSIQNELELLGNLNSQTRDLKSHVVQASLALSEWILKVENKAQDLQGMRFKKQKQLSILLAGMVGFFVLAWIGLAYLFRWQEIRIGEQVESEVKGVIEKGILGDQRFMVDHYSELTRTDIIRLLDDLKVKLNLGTMLHVGLPLSGCMIDPQFKVTWHNDLFLEQFYLSDEEVRSDEFNWDYLREYLNLEDDPVYNAIVNKVAGIYPVKVRQDEYTTSQPYEMYVTPINVNREDRVMVFFYPLLAVKEAITDQVNLSKNAMARFIESWNEYRLDEDQIRYFEKNFKNNDLEDTYRHLLNLYERLDCEKNEYLQLIRNLEKENTTYSQTLREMQSIEEEKQVVIKEQFQVASDLRDTFLATVERAESLTHINRTILQQNDDLKNEANKMQQVSIELMKKNKETIEIMGQLESVKLDYKKIKLELLEVKAKLISFNSSLVSQLPPLDETQHKLTTRYQNELSRLDFNVQNLDKKLSQLDVLLTKLQMMHEKGPLKQTHFDFMTSQKDHEMKETLIDVHRHQALAEEKIVESFKKLHSLMKQDLSKVQKAREISHETLENFLS